MADAVLSAIIDLETAFSVGIRQEPEQRARIRLLLRAVAVVPSWIARLALESLLWNNPGAPYPVTPQAVRERCLSVQAACDKAMARWALGHAWDATFGPEPFSRGATIPDEYAAEVIGKEIEASNAMRLLADLTGPDAEFLVQNCGGLSVVPDASRVPASYLPNGYAAAYKRASERVALIGGGA